MFIAMFHYSSVNQKNIWHHFYSMVESISSYTYLSFLVKNWQNIGFVPFVNANYWSVSTIDAVDVRV